MHKSKSVMLIKFGGAVITNKEIPNTLRPEVLTRLVAELAEIWKQDRDYVVLGNGVGSFAHVPATRYKTVQGFIDDESRIGMAITQDSAAQINRLVVKECLDAGLPAVTVAPSNSVVTTNTAHHTFYADVFEEYMRKGMLPVTHGDVLVDTEKGCSVWSTDKVFTFFAQEFVNRGWHVNNIIHVTEAEGVWKRNHNEWVLDKHGNKVIYPVITPEMRDEVQNAMVTTKGFDVTGGMWHKLEEALRLTKLGITTQIISGCVPGALTAAAQGDTSIGTIITAG